VPSVYEATSVFGLNLSSSAISTRGGHSGDSVVRKMPGRSLGSSPTAIRGVKWTDTPSTRKPLCNTNQNAGPSALLAHDRWCFSRSVSALSVRSSFCRARLRIPASLSPSKILGGSDLTAATACSNWIQILHGIAFTSFAAYTFYSLSGFARLTPASCSVLSHMFVRTDGRIGVGWKQSNSSPPASKPCSRRASVKYATARKEPFHELSPN
jgi:hypothetical protein